MFRKLQIALAFILLNTVTVSASDGTDPSNVEEISCDNVSHYLCSLQRSHVLLNRMAPTDNERTKYLFQIVRTAEDPKLSSAEQQQIQKLNRIVINAVAQQIPNNTSQDSRFRNYAYVAAAKIYADQINHAKIIFKALQDEDPNGINRYAGSVVTALAETKSPDALSFLQEFGFLQEKYDVAKVLHNGQKGKNEELLATLKKFSPGSKPYNIALTWAARNAHYPTIELGLEHAKQDEGLFPSFYSSLAHFKRNPTSVITKEEAHYLRDKIRLHPTGTAKLSRLTFIAGEEEQIVEDVSSRHLCMPDLPRKKYVINRGFVAALSKYHERLKTKIGLPGCYPYSNDERDSDIEKLHTMDAVIKTLTGNPFEDFDRFLDIVINRREHESKFFAMALYNQGHLDLLKRFLSKLNDANPSGPGVHIQKVIASLAEIHNDSAATVLIELLEAYPEYDVRAQSVLAEMVFKLVRSGQTTDLDGALLTYFKRNKENFNETAIKNWFGAIAYFEQSLPKSVGYMLTEILAQRTKASGRERPYYMAALNYAYQLLSKKKLAIKTSNDLYDLAIFTPRTKDLDRLFVELHISVLNTARPSGYDRNLKSYHVGGGGNWPKYTYIEDLKSFLFDS